MGSALCIARREPRPPSMNAPDDHFSDPVALRHAVRAGRFRRHTSGQAPGFAQGNLAILPSAFASDFLRFCQLNPKPCPILGVGAPGSPGIAALGEDLDLRTDVPRYRVYRDGALEREVDDLRTLWRDDLVAFVLGCSFSFEQALLDDGIPLRHVAQGRNVAMYRTNVPTVPAGPFRGPLVVSMRPLRPADAIRAVQITSRFPNVHGAPVHIGLPEAIGIRDLSRPDWGDPVEVRRDELPVFWACGVTPQAVIEEARPPLCITHAPGYMLVTDLKNSKLSVL